MAPSHPATKRRRTTRSTDTPAQPTTTAAAPPPAHSAPPTQPSTAPLSAVAARRAAREAQQAQQTQQQPPQPVAALPQLDDTAPSSSSSDEDEQPQPALTKQRKPAPRTTAKSKGKAPARYFAAEEEDDEDDVMLLDAGAEDDEAEAGAVSPPEGLDEGEEEALASARGGRSEPTTAGEEDEGTRTPRSRRREKSAFVDPYCVSAFHVVDGVSAVRTAVLDESGAERDAVVYALQEGENLILHGAFSLAPVFGSIHSLGSSLSAPSSASDHASSPLTLPALSSPAFHPFFCPSSHPLPPIYAIPRPPASYSTPAAVLLPSLTPGGEPTELDLSRFAAAVVVIDLETDVEGIERPLVVGGIGGAAGMWPRREKGVDGLRQGKTWKLITAPTPSLTSLRPMPDWDGALSAALPNLQDGAHDPGRFVALVEGPKRVGKSTMARTLVNALLDRYESVAYLDTDLGQPEFTPPGFVSLHILRRPLFGPSFTHLALPLSSQYFGITSPASDPSGYIAAAQALLETYALEVEYPLVDEPAAASSFSSRRRGRFAQRQAQQQQQQQEREVPSRIRERVPLVVNTQGWVKGLGADLLAQLKAAAQPTHVFSFAAADEGDPFAQPFGAGDEEQQQPPYHLLTLPPAPPTPLESKYSAADYRTLSLLSYFHASFPSAFTGLATSWNFSRSLVGSAPYPFSWAREAGQVSSVHLTGPGMGDGEIKYEHVLHTLNGSVVALVAGPPPSSPSSSSAWPFPYDPAQPSPTLATGSRALGLALVHSILPSSSTLHLLTPVPAALIAAHAPLALVRGPLELPLPMMLDYSVGVSEREREAGVAGMAYAAGGAEGGKDEQVVPFLAKVEEGNASAVGGRRRVRRNLMRRGQA
ncbi:hypothetical protein JCM8097_007226 [Rhodosporidiobolus ruineniae]